MVDVDDDGNDQHSCLLLCWAVPLLLALLALLRRMERLGVSRLQALAAL